MLLHAAFDRSRVSAQAAWHRWCLVEDLQTTDDTSLRLMGLVGRNLARHGIADVNLDRLRGLRRHNFVGHTRHVGRLVPLVAALRAQGVQPMLLGPVALGPLAYGELGPRAPGPSILLVPPTLVPTCVRVLRGLGFVPEGRHPPTLWRALLGESNLADQGYAAALRWGLDGVTVELRWALSPTHIGPSSDATVLARRVPFAFGELVVDTATAADHLLFTLLQRDDGPDWIADALSLLSTPIDWPTFVAEVERRGLGAPVHDALRYLATEFTELTIAVPALTQAPRPPALLLPHLDGRPPLEAARVSARFAMHRLAGSPIVQRLSPLLRPAWRLFGRHI